jgi:hypothetical protein
MEIIKNIKKLANWKIILLIGIIMMSFYIFVGIFSNSLMSKSNLLEPHKTLNSIFNYSNQEAYDLLASYTPQEKETMMKFTYPCDFFVAISYGVFLTFFLFGIYKSLVKEKYLKSLMFPLVASIMNIIGNILILTMLAQLDNKILFEKLAPISNIINTLKVTIQQKKWFI